MEHRPERVAGAVRLRQSGKPIATLIHPSRSRPVPVNTPIPWAKGPVVLVRPGLSVFRASIQQIQSNPQTRKETQFMAIKLNAAYSKKLGLPHYSSHSFSASVEVELTDPGRIAAETARLYGVLQTSVDNEIRQVGYLPVDDLEPQRGLATDFPDFRGKERHEDNGRVPTPSRARRHTTPVNGHASWRCSDKQRRLLTDLCRELRLSEEDLDERAQRLFQHPVRQLNKLSASGLISDLLGEAESLRQGQGKGSAPSSYPGGAA